MKSKEKTQRAVRPRNPVVRALSRLRLGAGRHGGSGRQQKGRELDELALDERVRRTGEW